MDIVLEDYKKKYLCLEIKYTKKRQIVSVFPLQHQFKLIDNKNYFYEIKKLLN